MLYLPKRSLRHHRVRYPHRVEFAQLSSHLSSLLETLKPLFAQASDSHWSYASAPGKWTRLEILGHLVDSAANNHQRFVRALSQPSLEWPGYDQEAHVRVQRFAQADPRLVQNVFFAFNFHLAWLFGQFPPEKLATPCKVGDAPLMSLEDLALDYVAHLEHHLRQIVGSLSTPETVRYSGLPWPAADPHRQWPA